MSSEIVRAPQGAIQVQSLDDVERIARTAVASGLVRVKRAEEAAVILLTGRELGLSPMQSLRGIYVVNGTPVLSADLLVAVVRASGLCLSWRTVESTPEVCTLETRRRGEDQPARRTWTMADAKRAGLTGKQTWAQYPAAMLRHRCAADLAREVYPDVCLGLYTPDEAEDFRGNAQAAQESHSSIPSLESIGVEAQRRQEAHAQAAGPLTSRELEAILAQIAQAKTLVGLVALREDLKPEYKRADESQQKKIAAAFATRKHQLTPPPPDGTDGDAHRSGEHARAEGAANDTAAATGPRDSATMDAAAYFGTKSCRRAVENAVRLHGRAQSPAWLRVAAERVVALDTPSDDGARLNTIGATQLVERWAHEGPVKSAQGTARVVVTATARRRAG